MKRVLTFAFAFAAAFCGIAAEPVATEIGDMRDTDKVMKFSDVVQFVQDYVGENASDGTANILISEKADTYRNGSSGQLGSGYAHTAITGDGRKRYAAYAPSVNVRLRIVSTSDYNPLLQHFANDGDDVVLGPSDLIGEVTSISSYVSDCGKGEGGYDSIRVMFTPKGTETIPISVTVSKNILQSDVTMYDSSTTQYDYITIGNIYIYSFYANGLGDYEYYCEWYEDGYGYHYEYCSFSVEVESFGETDYVMTAFGDGGQFITNKDADTARSEKVLRTGKAGERGTGYGYKIYDFTSDVRMWELKVPRLDLAAFPSISTAISTTQVNTNAYGFISGNRGSFVYHYPMQHFLNPNNVQFKAYKYATETADAYSTDGCKKVEYDVGIIPLDANRIENGEFAFNLKFHNSVGTSYGYSRNAEFVDSDKYVMTMMTNSLNTTSSGSAKNIVSFYKTMPNLTFTVTNSVTKTIGSKSLTFKNIATIRNIGLRYSTYSGGTPYQTPPVFVNGRNTIVSIGYIADYETDCYYYDANNVAQLAPYRIRGATVVNVPLTFTAYPSTLETVRVLADRIVTDKNNGMYWDEDLGVTWELKVRNGAFYGTILGTKDYRKEDY